MPDEPTPQEEALETPQTGTEEPETEAEDLPYPEEEVFPSVPDDELEEQMASGQPAETPDKFAGKTPEDIIKSYQELERKLGEQASRIQELEQRSRPEVRYGSLIPKSEEEYNRATAIMGLEPREMAYNQEAVDYAYENLGFSEDQIDKFTEMDWKSIRDQAGLGVQATQDYIQRRQAEQAVQAQAYEEQARNAFLQQNPDLAGQDELLAFAEQQVMLENQASGHQIGSWEEYVTAVSTRARELRARFAGTPGPEPQRIPPRPRLVPPAAAPTHRPGLSPAQQERFVSPEELAKW